MVEVQVCKVGWLWYVCMYVGNVIYVVICNMHVCTYVRIYVCM